MPDDTPPRSRFDRGEPAPRSRFDRRSRSPSRREPESRRTRSPVGREATDSPSTVSSQPPKDPLAAAAAAKAAAAKISAQLQAGKGIQHVEVPPIRTPKAVASPPVIPSPSSNKGSAVVGEAYQQDGDYIQDIEINDLRNRYTLTKGAVQKKVNCSVVPLIGSGSPSSLCIGPHALQLHR